MAGGDELLVGANVQRVGAALLFMGAGTNVYDAFSAVMSSPWSTQKFSEDAEADRLAMEYVYHGIAISMAYAIGGAVLARSVWPVVGAVGVMVYMYWLYARALGKAREKRTSVADAWVQVAPDFLASMAGGAL
jgi:hypothetical protein